jgi:hypothetical protein
MRKPGTSGSIRYVVRRSQILYNNDDEDRHQYSPMYL